MTPIDLEGLRALLAGKRHDAYVEVFAPQLSALLAERDAQAEEIARLRPLAEAVKAWDARGSTHWSTRDGPLEAALTAYETALRSAAQPAAEPWQPIRPGTHDGEVMFLRCGVHRPFVGEWNGAEERWVADNGCAYQPDQCMPVPPSGPRDIFAASAAAAERGETPSETYRRWVRQTNRMRDDGTVPPAERAPHGEDGGAL